jgi:hypothetical protein
MMKTKKKKKKSERAKERDQERRREKVVNLGVGESHVSSASTTNFFQTRKKKLPPLENQKPNPSAPAHPLRN